MTPLTRATSATIRVWLAERQGSADDPLFPTSTGRQLSRDTAAIRLLHAGVDTSVIALWLGHASPTTTQIYLDADLELKQRALDRTATPDGKPGRYQAPDRLLAFLEAL